MAIDFEKEFGVNAGYAEEIYERWRGGGESVDPEWVEWFQGKDICFGPVRDLAEAFADPFMAERGMLLHDSTGHAHIGNPIHFQDEPGQVDFQTPGLGQHTREILASIGYSMVN